MSEPPTWRDLQITAARGTVRNAAIAAGSLGLAPSVWMAGIPSTAVVMVVFGLGCVWFAFRWWRQFKDCLGRGR